MEQLNELDEIRQDAIQRTNLVQQRRSKWHDKYIKERKFQPGDWELLFDSKFKDFQGKFQTHWLGPYEIEISLTMVQLGSELLMKKGSLFL